MNLDDALKRAAELGCTVSQLRRTGEVRVELPGRRRKLRLNMRRKDCPAVLESVIRQIENGSLREDAPRVPVERPEQEEQPKEKKRIRLRPIPLPPKSERLAVVPEPVQLKPAEPAPPKPAEPVWVEPAEPELEEVEPVDIEETREELARALERERRRQLEEAREDEEFDKEYRVYRIVSAKPEPGPPMQVGLTTAQMEANRERKRAERAAREQEKIRKAAEKRKRQEERRAKTDLSDPGPQA